MGGIEALKAKTKAKLIEEKGSINPVDERVDNHEEADSLKANPDLDNAHQSSLIDGDDDEPKKKSVSFLLEKEVWKPSTTDEDTSYMLLVPLFKPRTYDQFKK